MREFRGDWRDLFHVFRIALDPRKLSLSFLGLSGSLIGLGLLLSVFAFAGDQIAFRRGALPLDDTFAARLNAGQWTLAGERMGAFLREHLGAAPWAGLAERSALARRLARLADAVVPLQAVGCVATCLCPRTAAGWGFLAAAAAWCWFLWAAFAGAITRIAAVEIARDERMELAEAAGYAAKNYRMYFWAPVSAGLFILFFAGCNAAAGFLLRGLYHAADNRFWNLGSTAEAFAHGAAGILLVAGFPLALLSGFLIVLLGIGLAAGWPLMIPAASAEGTDAFDAVSRAFSYVFNRPWRYIGYHLTAALYAVPCVLFVTGFACAFTHVAVATGEWGMGAAFSDGFGAPLRAALGVLGIGSGATALPTGWLVCAAGWALAGMVVLVFGYAASYVPSYAFTAWTMMYFLLRRSADGTDMKEVYEEAVEDEDAAVAEPAPPPPPPSDPPPAAR